MNCRAELAGDVLVIENSLIRREFAWNGGAISTRLLLDRRSGQRWESSDSGPDLLFPNEPDAPRSEARMTSSVVATPWEREHLAVEVTYRQGGLEVKRIFRLFEDCPAIACELYLRGKSGCTTWLNREDTDGLQFKGRRPGPVMERVPYGARHLQLQSVQFFDRTDMFNALVQQQKAAPFRLSVCLQGNLLLAVDVREQAGFFILKESACSDVQGCNPGCDYVAHRGVAQLLGIGVEPCDLWTDDWLRCFGSVTGVASGGEQGVLEALRTYHTLRRPARPGRDTMVLLNTWGDRGGAGRVNESFVLQEIAAAARLGVTHLQVDDGWQVGNFSDPGSKPLRIGDFWEVNRKKFPRGLGPVVEAARQAGIELGLWYAAESADDYRHWENNADILIRLHREHGIRVFKSDGINLTSMRGATNLRRMFERVIRETNGQAYFNVDVTAGRRLGYHGLSEYGDVFVENRYTDWGNYYPHWTLRNLWQLSRYMPPQVLQMEFLNHTRNGGKYPEGDPLAPARVPIDYCFAICMMSQPLAWFEASQLPEALMGVLAPLIRTYLRHVEAIFAGQIFPIGEEPSGVSWTGFQSANGTAGYVLVFRELNERSQALLRLRHAAGKSLAFTHVAGAGADFRATADADGGVPFALPKAFGFALYAYQVSR
jgi:hypothetical protein